jgi:hypothetical protein
MDPYPFNIIVNPFNPGDVIGPAGGISAPFQQLIENITDRGIHPYFMYVQYGITVWINTGALHHPLVIIITLLIRRILDPSVFIRLVQQEIEYIR